MSKSYGCHDRHTREATESQSPPWWPSLSQLVHFLTERNTKATDSTQDLAISSANNSSSPSLWGNSHQKMKYVSLLILAAFNAWKLILRKHLLPVLPVLCYQDTEGKTSYPCSHSQQKYPSKDHTSTTSSQRVTLVWFCIVEHWRYCHKRCKTVTRDFPNSQSQSTIRHLRSVMHRNIKHRSILWL
jgi:hypothetical protein